MPKIQKSSPNLALANQKSSRESSFAKSQKLTKSHTSRNILIAFLLNFGFSIYEFIGGSLTGSTAIMSDAIHDLGDAISIGLSFLLEKKSAKQPNETYTYGYLRYSLLSGLITTLILVLGSVIVIFNAILRLFQPSPINYDGMIMLALIGTIVNLIAVRFTSHGESLNQKSVNLHMLEDVLGWIIVLIGAIVMKFIDITYLDPILSIGIALFVAISAIKNLCAILDIFLEKTPANLSLADLRTHLLSLPHIQGIHHLHLWSIDEYHHYATLHVVTNQPTPTLKNTIRQELAKHHISHATIELESPNEHCHDLECRPTAVSTPAHHHH